MGQRLLFGDGIGQMQAAVHADALRYGLLYQSIQRLQPHGVKHGLDLHGLKAEVAVGKPVRRIEPSGSSRSRKHFLLPDCRS